MLLSDCKHITIVTHVNPDGDAIGSTTGFKYFLEQNGKSVSIVVPISSVMGLSLYQFMINNKKNRGE